MDYWIEMPPDDMTQNAVKMRLCRFLSSCVIPSSANGIEKVRGSTPLISTTSQVRFAQWIKG